MEAVVMTPKLDGAAVSLQYLDSVLHQALTRGDGKEDLDITTKSRHLFLNTSDALDGYTSNHSEVVAPKIIETQGTMQQEHSI